MKKSSNVRTITSFVLLLCMLLLSACGGQKAASAPAQIYVTPPAGWEKVENANVAAQYKKDACSFVVTYESMDSKANSLDSFIDYAKGQYNSAFQDVQYGEVKKTTIGGLESRELDFSCTLSDVPIQYAVFIAVKDGYAYSFTCGGPEEGFDQQKGDYDSFISSIQFK